MKLSSVLRSPPKGSVLRVLAIARKLPDGEVLSSAEIAREARISISTLWQVSHDPSLRRHRIKIRKSVFWGNAKTIHEAR